MRTGSKYYFIKFFTQRSLLFAVLYLVVLGTPLGAVSVATGAEPLIKLRSELPQVSGNVGSGLRKILVEKREAKHTVLAFDIKTKKSEPKIKLKGAETAKDPLKRSFENDLNIMETVDDSWGIEKVQDIFQEGNENNILEKSVPDAHAEPDGWFIKEMPLATSPAGPSYGNDWVIDLPEKSLPVEPSPVEPLFEEFSPVESSLVMPSPSQIPHAGGLFGSYPAHSPPSLVEIDIYDVWRMALGHHEAVGIAGEDLRLSELEIDRAYSNFLPRVEAEASYKRYTKKETSDDVVQQPRSSTGYEVGLTQPVYSGGRASSWYRQVKHEHRFEQYGYEVARVRVVMDASLAFYDHLNASQEHNIYSFSLERAMEHLRVARKRYELGVGIKADVLRAEAEAADKETKLLRAQADSYNTMTEFRRLTGFRGEFKISKTYKPSSVDMRVEELIGLAFKKRRDYLGKKAREDAAKEGVKYAKSSFMPYVDLKGNYLYKDQHPDVGTLPSHSGYGMLTFTLPIFEGGLRRAELKQARSRSRRADLLRLGARRDIELEVRRAFTNMYAAMTIVKLSERELAYAAENYRMIFGRFRLGLATSTEVVDAEATLIAAEIGIYTARDGYELAVLELKRSSGILLDEVNARVK